MESESESGGGMVDFDTLRGRDYPTLRQFTVFLENRVGQLMDVIRRFEGSAVRIVAININDSTECSIVRLVLTNPEAGREVLERAGLAIIESDLIAIELHETKQPMLEVCTALLRAEVNLVQAYPLLLRPAGGSYVALMVDNIELAQQTLAERNFHMLNEDELLDL